jgi:cobalt-zinc-cadmium efflux system outer membrane protein
MGCASAPSRQSSFADVHRTVADRIGADVRWNAPSPQSDAQLDAAVRGMLAKELTADEAVQVALLYNRNLQATFEDLGIAHADLVQAGLLKNPVFDLGIRFPDRPPGKTYLNFAITESFLDVLWLPARKRIAAAQFEQVKAKITDEVLKLAADTKSAFYAYQAAEHSVELRRTVLDAMTASAQAAKALHDAGNMTDVDFLAQRAQEVRARIDLKNAESDAVDAKEKVTALMGLGASQTDWKSAGRLPDLPANEIEPNGLESLAIRQRADLAAAKSEVIALGRTAGLAEQTRFFAQADLGLEAERETEGQWRIGPALSLPLPIFDQGQAVVERSAAALRQSQQRYAALAVEIRSQVRAARAKMFAAREKATYYRDELLPLQQQVIDQTLRQYNGMYVGVFQLLQAKRDQVDAGREYIDSLREYWLARCELERAIGGRLPGSSHPSTLPAATQPAADHEHEGHHP